MLWNQLRLKGILISSTRILVKKTDVQSVDNKVKGVSITRSGTRKMEFVGIIGRAGIKRPGKIKRGLVIVSVTVATEIVMAKER